MDVNEELKVLEEFKSKIWGGSGGESGTGWGSG